MQEQGSKPNVRTIAPSAPFLETLADAILSGALIPPADGGDPHPLADHFVLLPTRRACRAFADVLAARAGGAAIFLPRIRPLGDVDEAELAFGPVDLPESGEAALTLPAAIDPLRRQLLLTELVLQWGRTVARTLQVPGREEPVAIPVRPGDAALLARDLARLLDDFETEGRDFAALGRLVTGDHAAYWAITLEFLKIATEQWPAILAGEGRVDPAARRDALLRAEGRRLAESSAGPVIAAGSTGTIPATAELLAVIARLPRGAVVLPGLDRDLDAGSWAAIDAILESLPGHPQYGLKHLISRLGIIREEVEPLGEPRRRERERLVSETFRPAPTTELWAQLPDRLDAAALEAACEGLSVIESAGEQDEAAAIALVLREALESRGEEAVLVTPDRGLARRVSAELKRWDVEVDDSAGMPLADTAPGTLFRLVADAATARVAPVPLVALMQHPMASFGLDPAAARRAARALEIVALRGVRPRLGAEGLKRAVTHALDSGDDAYTHPVVRRLVKSSGGLIRELADRIAAALAPLEALADGDAIPLGTIVAAHLAAFETVAATSESGFDPDADEAAKALGGFLDDLTLAGDTDLAVALDEYPALVGVLMGGRPVRPARSGHPRLQILGPLEARLVAGDIVVLGGLNEGSWPADTRTDPFLNRPMRAEVGLEAPDRFIGLSAHDAAMLLCAPRVVATRAAKVGGEPTVASRWLQRLKAVAGEARYASIVAAGGRYLDWARRLDHAGTRDTVAEPMPCPAVAARPSRLSVTEIETLIRDPYAIYAKHVLQLRKLDPLDAAPDAADRGSIVHDALHRFGETLKDGGVADPVAALVAIGEELFAALDDFPELKAVWWPRFLRIAAWYAPRFAEERATLARSHAETRGEHVFDVLGRPFVLAGRADRIDEMPDGRIRLIDYKTGTVPSIKQVESGLSPQLPLEAAMAQAGAFEEVPPGCPIAGLTYVALTGGEPPGAITDIRPKETTLDALAAEALAGLERMLARFADPAVPYRAKTHVQQRRFATDYDHLARYVEWSAVVGGEE